MCGTYIQIDGIDGSGKSTLLQAAKNWFAERNLAVFDTVAWSQEHRRPPTFEEIGSADVLMTAEPMHSWIGSAIREEIIRTGASYGARFTAEAFALDRAIQITRYVRRFLENPKHWVIQDRGLISSTAYQPLQSERDGDADPVTIPWLLSLPGNRIALDVPPDAFILLDLDPTIAQARLGDRVEKQDDVRFEQSDFQSALSKRFRDPAVTEPFRARGTRILTIDGSLTKEGVAERMREILEGLNDE